MKKHYECPIFNLKELFSGRDVLALSTRPFQLGDDYSNGFFE